jgi:hypothetical protein
MIALQNLKKTNENSSAGDILERFARSGLNVHEVWLSNGSAKADLHVLKQLERWAVAFSEDGKAAMKSRGFEFPPIQPGYGPEADWLRFERWLTGQPLSWDVKDIAAKMPLADGLSDVDVERNWAHLTDLITEKGIVVDYPDSVSLRCRYDRLVLELRDSDFEVVDEHTITHLTGCNGDCESCPFKNECACMEEFMWDDEEEID